MQKIDLSQMNYGPIYRHGSSLVKASVHREHLFDLAKQPTFKFALDWLVIYQLYQEGYSFQKTDSIIEIYLLGGASYGFEQNLKYNRMVVTGKPLTLKDKISIKCRYISYICNYF